MIDYDDVWLVVPIFNEQGRIGKVIEEASKYVSNIVVVDDHSTDDGHLEVSKQGKDIKYFMRLEKNLGKAMALLTGCDWARDAGAKAIIVMDGDGQHDPNRLSEFMKLICSGDYDIVFGSRAIHDQNMPFVRRVGNSVVSNTLAFLFGIRVVDALSGFKAFTVETYEKIRWDTSTRYLVESDIFINVAKNNLRRKEIMVPTIYNDKYHGITKTDGAKIFLHILWRRLFG